MKLSVATLVVILALYFLLRRAPERKVLVEMGEPVIIARNAGIGTQR